MGAGKKLLTFLSGGLLGAAVGTTTAILWAPRGGTELRGRLIDRIRQIQLAGEEAKAAKSDELIQKFRQEVEDPTALRDEEARLRVEAAQAVTAIGLGLNAPGAIAAQEAALRTTGTPPAPRSATSPAPAAPPDSNPDS